MVAAPSFGKLGCSNFSPSAAGLLGGWFMHPRRAQWFVLTALVSWMGGEKVPGGPIQVCSRCLVSTTFGWWLTTSACLQKRTCSGRRVSWRLIAAWWSRRLLHNVVTRGATSNSITVLVGACRWCAVDVPDSFATTTSATTLSTALDASHASSLEMGRRRDGSGLRSPSPPSPTGPGVVGELMEMEVSKRL